MIISTGRSGNVEKALSALEKIQKNSFLVVNYQYHYRTLRLPAGLELPQMSKEGTRVTVALT